MSTSCTRSLGRLRQAHVLVAAVAGAIDELSPAAALQLVGPLGALSRLCESATLRAGRQVGDASARRLAGEKSAASLVAAARRTSLAKAKSGLMVLERAARFEVLDAALARGELSMDQAALVAPAAAAAQGVDPLVGAQLVAAAGKVPYATLSHEAKRAIQRARGEAHACEREQRIHARRYWRTFTGTTGGVRIDALLGALDGARVRSVVDREARRLMDPSHPETFEHLCADAAVGLLVKGPRVRGGPGGEAGSGAAGGAGPEVLVRVDAAALVRGEVEGDERCEIQGVGPVSVRTATELIGEGFFTIVVHDGTDIRTVTSTTRTIPTKLKKALLARDETCVVPGCAASDHLEIDHWKVDFARFGATHIDNLCRLCPAHHRMKTRTGWRLAGGPGRWRWLAPRPWPGPGRGDQGRGDQGRGTQGRGSQGRAGDRGGLEWDP